MSLNHLLFLGVATQSWGVLLIESVSVEREIIFCGVDVARSLVYNLV
jgi:hypothetical protein